MRMMTDGGGGTSRTAVTSGVTVDLGDIRDFARFLDEMAREVKLVEEALKARHEAADPLEFGAYHASQAAQKRHEQSLRAAVDNAEALRARMEELAGGTLALARRYSDLEELNRAIGGDVADALRRKA